MPPLLTASSNVFVVPAVDRLYLVVSAGVTRLSEVDRCMNLAQEAQTEISGVVINNPACTAKTYPNFFTDLTQLIAASAGNLFRTVSNAGSVNDPV